MDPMTAGILLNVGGLVASQIGGGRPKYDIPDSAKQALSRAKISALDPMSPGESRKMSAAGLSAANANRVAQESGNALEAVASIQGRNDATNQQILAESEMNDRQDQNQLMDLLLHMGQYEDMEFQMNKFAPYADKQREMRDILGGLTTNMFNLAERERMADLLKSMGGGAGSPSTGVKLPKSLNPLSGVDPSMLAGLLLP